MKTKSIRVIFDTNVWISFLIGKRLTSIKTHISNALIIIITTDQLLMELEKVTGREKLIKYFPKESVSELIGLLKTIAEKIEIKPTYTLCRDPKANFLSDCLFCKSRLPGNRRQRSSGTEPFQNSSNNHSC